MAFLAERIRQTLPAWTTLLVLMCGEAAPLKGASPLVQSQQGVLQLTLDDFIQQILENNEALQIRILEVEIARRRYKGEQGIFEPELVATYDYLESERENTAEQERNLNVPVFEEKNNIYSGGLESLLPSGAQVQLGYTMRDLYNNLLGNSIFSTTQGFTNQYSMFLGASVTQPLLKNGGRAATMANIRVAALPSDIAFQEYRRQLMLLIAAAEASYWNLYLAQEQLLFFRESVELAESILRDNKTRLDAGRGSELEVLEAEAALSLRRSRQSEALQDYFESANRMAMLISRSVMSTNRLLVAVEAPKEEAVRYDYFRSWQNAFELNPDYLSQQKKLLQEKIRLAFARNQRWPQLDLKASYGLNGLGETPWDAWEDVETQNFPTWSIGMELRIPITGGIRSRHELNAAKIRQQQALLGLKELETQIANGLDTAMRKVGTSKASLGSYRKTVEFTQSLLDTQLARLDVGRVESRKVLETEEDLFVAKTNVVSAVVNHRRAQIELELIEGSVLRTRNIDLDKGELEHRTSDLVRGGRISDTQYRDFVQAMHWEYSKNRGFKGPSLPPYYYSNPIPNLGLPEPMPVMTPDQEQEAIDLLRATSPSLPTGDGGSP